MVGQLPSAAQPLAPAGVLVEVQQRVGAAGAAAAERRAGARLVPSIPGAELRELQPLRVAEEAVGEGEEEELAGAAVAPAGHDLGGRTVDLDSPVRAAAGVRLQRRQLAEALDEARRQRVAGGGAPSQRRVDVAGPTVRDAEECAGGRGCDPRP